MARGDVTAAAEALLDSAATGVKAGSVLDCSPYITHGPPALDCCRVIAVTVEGIDLADSRSGSSNMGEHTRVRRLGVVLIASFRVTVTGCFPTSASPPDAVDVQAAAGEVLDQAWGVYNRVLGDLQAGSLFPAGCRLVSIGGLDIIPVNGGCGGWSFQVRAQLDGYDQAAVGD